MTDFYEITDRLKSGDSVTDEELLLLLDGGEDSDAYLAASAREVR